MREMLGIQIGLPPVVLLSGIEPTPLAQVTASPTSVPGSYPGWHLSLLSADRFFDEIQTAVRIAISPSLEL
jgi:hypothetical protein